MASANVEVVQDGKAGSRIVPAFAIYQRTHMTTIKSCFNKCDSIPVRNGTRPNTICGPLHIQCGSSGSDRYFRKLLTEVLAWPRVECTPPIGRSPDLISIQLKQADQAIASSTSSLRFAQVYLQAPTIVLALPLVTAHWAIVRGWAEPHFLASQCLIPAGTVLLYVPTDEIEREVCRFHFSRAYEFARTSLEVKPAYAKGNC